MKTIQRTSGIRVSIPGTIQLPSESTPGVTKRGVGPPRRITGTVPMPSAAPRTPTAADATCATLVVALQQQDLSLVDTVPLQTTPLTGATRRAAPTPSAATVDLDVSDEEDAVMLIEREDGTLEWRWPESAPKPKRQRGTRVAAQTGRMLRFTVPMKARPQLSTKRAGAKRGPVTDWIVEKVTDAAKAYIFKFVVRAGVKVLTHQLEKNVRRGLMQMQASTPDKWRPIETLSEVTLPQDRPARLLVFIHGTFSSTTGSYGALGLTPWGMDFLRAAAGRYDALIGFDHPTLSVDPLVNANDFIARMRFDTLAHAPHLDIICFSRGGLVYRTLAEEMFPRMASPPKIGRVIFAACTLSGTTLGKPENWHAFADFYTNLAVAGARLLSLLPSASVKTAAALMQGATQGLGDFVKCLATTIVTEKEMPGLAAMNPDGVFVRKLNTDQPDPPTPATSWYAAITSDFEPAGVLENDLEGFPKGLAVKMLDCAVDQLLTEPNDLVVHVASMTAVDPHLGSFMKDHYTFGTNSKVYHTNYFTQPETVSALARWLQLVPTTADMPARVDTEVSTFPITIPCHIISNTLRRSPPSHVVLEREWQGNILRYAYATEELLNEISQAEAQLPVGDVINFHETDSSGQTTVQNVRQGTEYKSPRIGPPPRGTPTSQRFVVMDGPTVIGVLPETDSATLRSRSLPELAREMPRPGGPRRAISLDSAVRATRSMPSLTRFRSGFKRSKPPVLPQVEPLPVALEATPPPNQVACHFLAECEDKVELQKTASVTVKVSREAILATLGNHTGGTASVLADKPLTIEFLARKNIEAVSDTRVDLACPAPGEEKEIIFDFIPICEPEGELNIRVRQGSVPCLTLKLSFAIVAQRTGQVRRVTTESDMQPPQDWPDSPVQLRINEFTRGLDTLYHFTLSSQKLGFDINADSPRFTGDRLAYVKALYARIENRVVLSKGDIKAFEREMRAEGGQLLDELIPKSIQELLWKHRLKIDSIQVLSEEPFIPWEILCLKDPAKGVVTPACPFLAELGLVRWYTPKDMTDNSMPTQMLRVRPGRAFHIIPAYPHPDYVLPEAAEEEKFLVKTFGSQRLAAESNTIADKLAEGGSLDLLHFAGHGDADSASIADAGLLLQGKVVGQEYVMDTLRATVIKNTATLAGDDGSRPIIVLNACRAARLGTCLTRVGGFADAFILRGAGIFIGAQWSVGDTPARSFTEAFYRSLKKRGTTIAQATKAARTAARDAGEMTWLAYAVYGHPDAQLTID